MNGKERKLQLLPSRHDMPASHKQFRCGERILESGIYRVVHRKHRLPHEVTLLRDQLFPRCIKCEDDVFFQLLRSAPDITLAPFRVALYALPVADEADEAETDFTIAS
jgi:hypothetical protein